MEKTQRIQRAMTELARTGSHWEKAFAELWFRSDGVRSRKLKEAFEDEIEAMIDAAEWRMSLRDPS